MKGMRKKKKIKKGAKENGNQEFVSKKGSERNV
jgi:hypothetical protein